MSCIDANTETEYMQNEKEAKRIGQACFIDLQKAATRGFVDKFSTLGAVCVLRRTLKVEKQFT